VGDRKSSPPLPGHTENLNAMGISLARAWSVRTGFILFRQAEASDLPGFEATSWYCIVAPADVPEPIVKILNSPEIRDRLIEGADVETPTPEELMAFVRVEIPKRTKTVKDSGAKLD
jgi:hypothetical protein